MNEYCKCSTIKNMYLCVRTETASVAKVQSIVATTSVGSKPRIQFQNDHNETIEYNYEPHMSCPICGRRPHPVIAVRDLPGEVQDQFVLPCTSQRTCKYFIFQRLQFVYQCNTPKCIHTYVGILLCTICYIP